MSGPSWAEVFCTWMVLKHDVTSPSWRMAIPFARQSTSVPRISLNDWHCKKSLHSDFDLKQTVTLASPRLVIYSTLSSFINAVVLKSQGCEAPLKKEKDTAAWPRRALLLSYFHSALSPAGPVKILIMASHSSSSGSGPSVEDRIDSLETSMGRLRARLDSQDKRLQATSQAGEKTWDILNEDIRKLREDHSASSKNLENFKDEVRTGFKDAANTHGDFGK